MNNPSETSEPNSFPPNQALYLLGFSQNLESTCERKMACVSNMDSGTTAMLRHLEIEYVTVSDLSAWYKTIDRADFEGDQGEKNLADIQWLTPRVIAHERVVSGLSQQFPFYPSRFGTLFSSKASLVAFAMSTQVTLRDYFHRVGDKLEWGLKFYGDTLKAAEILAQRDGIVHHGKPLGGANYLKLRQMQRESNASTQRLMSQSYEQALGSIQSHFQHVTSRPLVASQADSKREELVGNIALLVSQDESQRLLEWADDWNQTRQLESALRIEITGPWPAYSFCPSLSPIDTKEAA